MATKSNSPSTIRVPPQVLPGIPMDPQTPQSHSVDRTYQILRELEDQKVQATSNTLAALLDVSVPAPINGQVLEYITADGKWEAVTPTTGGNVTTSDVEASRPAGTEGDLFLPTNGYQIERKGASVYAAWGPIFPLAVPDDASYSWVNQSTATVTTTKGGIHLLQPAGSTGTNASLRVKSAPATPYTLTAFLLHNCL